MSQRSAFYLVILFSCCLLMLNGCGLKESDALKNYRNLELVPEGQQNGVVSFGQPYPDVTNFLGQLVLQNLTFKATVSENLSFVEGVRHEYLLTVQFLVGQVTFDVEPTTVPEGLTIESVSKSENTSVYKIIWQVQEGFVADPKVALQDYLRFRLTNIEYVSDAQAVNESTRIKYESLVNKQVDLQYVVRKSTESPSLAINNLSGSRRLGEEHRFSVDVTVPGTNDPVAPQISYDMSYLITENQLVEADGSYFVVSDSERHPPERVNDTTWRFHYIFDTLNKSIPPQYTTALNVVENPNQLFVNIRFQVNSSEQYSISDKVVQRFYIDLTGTD